jgi:hypothetical protein
MLANVTALFIVLSIVIAFILGYDIRGFIIKLNESNDNSISTNQSSNNKNEVKEG